MKIATLAIGIGNVRSVVRALTQAIPGATAAEIVTTADPEVVRSADVVVVPGQGSFGGFAEAMAGRGLVEAVEERIEAGTPYLGICLGLQILFESSEEAEGVSGLGVLSGRVKRLVPRADALTTRPHPLPHIGWNRVELNAAAASPGLVEPDHYFFAHSYAADPVDPRVVLATTSYGEATFASAVAKDNIVGIQFHPEKSQRAGLALLERFFTRVTRR